MKTINYLLVKMMLISTCHAFAQPANDACADAQDLPCGTISLSATTAGAVSQTHNTGCTMSNYGVWYKFTGDGQQTTISTNPSFDIKLSVATGSCGSLTNVVCTDSAPETATFTTVSGVTYYVYIAHWSSSNTTTGAFTISRSCTPPPPPPSPCSSAKPLPCGTFGLAGTTVGAPSIAHNTGCTMSNYGTWYSFVGDGQQTIISTNPAFDIKLSVATGSCGSLTNIVCTDSAPETATFTTVSGVTYYVYIAHWSSSNTTTGAFTISRSCMPPPEISEAGGAVCDESVPFCSGSYLFPNTTGASAPVGPDYACLFDQPNPAWYYMEISQGGTLELLIEQENNSGGGLDVDFALWGPFTNIATACTQIGNATALPIQSSYSSSSTETIGIGVPGGSNSLCDYGNGQTTPAAAIAGQIYVAMITNYSDNPGYITFSQTGGTAATNCDIVELSSATDLKGNYSMGENHLMWDFFGNISNVVRFELMRSEDGKEWELVQHADVGDYNETNKYHVSDDEFTAQSFNYYKVVTLNFDGDVQETPVLAIDNRDVKGKQLVKMVDVLGQEVDEYYKGLIIYVYSNGSIVKKYNNLK